MNEKVLYTGGLWGDKRSKLLVSYLTYRWPDLQGWVTSCVLLRGYAFVSTLRRATKGR